MLRHIREVHPYFESAVSCGFNGCAATPSTFEGLKKHLYRYHRDLLDIEEDSSTVVVSGDERVGNVDDGARDGEDYIERQQYHLNQLLCWVLSLL